MNEAGRVEFACGNQEAVGVADVSIRERGFRGARAAGAGGFATAGRAGAGFAAGGAGATFFACGLAGAAVRVVRTLVGLDAFLGCAFRRTAFGAAAEVLRFAGFTAFVGFCFPTDFFLEDAAVERPAFFPFAAGIAAPFPFLQS
jgi:hypothetical protein